MLRIDAGHIQPPAHQRRQDIPGGNKLPSIVKNYTQTAAAFFFKGLEPGFEQRGIENMIPLIGGLEGQIARLRPPGGKHKSGSSDQCHDHSDPDTHDDLFSRLCRVRPPCAGTASEAHEQAMLID